MDKRDSSVPEGNFLRRILDKVGIFTDGRTEAEAIIARMSERVSHLRKCGYPWGGRIHITSTEVEQKLTFTLKLYYEKEGQLFEEDTTSVLSRTSLANISFMSDEDKADLLRDTEIVYDINLSEDTDDITSQLERVHAAEEGADNTS